MLICDDLSKKCNAIFKKCFWKLLSYLACMPSFKSINSSFLSRKTYDDDNFTSTFPKWLKGQNTSVGIALIELTKPSDTLSYKPFLKHCILQTVLQVIFLFIFVWNKALCSINWAVFCIFLDLAWVVIWSYSIKCSVFLVLFFIRLYGIRDSLVTADITCWK